MDRINEIMNKINEKKKINEKNKTNETNEMNELNKWIKENTDKVFRIEATNENEVRVGFNIFGEDMFEDYELDIKFKDINDLEKKLDKYLIKNNNFIREHWKNNLSIFIDNGGYANEEFKMSYYEGIISVSSYYLNDKKRVKYSAKIEDVWEYLDDKYGKNDWAWKWDRDWATKMYEETYDTSYEYKLVIKILDTMENLLEYFKIKSDTGWYNVCYGLEEYASYKIGAKFEKNIPGSKNKKEIKIMKKLSKKQVREIKEWVDINVDKLFNVSVEYTLNETDELVLLLKIENDVLEYDGSSKYELYSFDEVKEELEKYIINDKNNKLGKGFKKEACIDWDYEYKINKDIDDDGTFGNYITVYPMYKDGEYSASFNIDGVQKDLFVSEKEINKWLKQKGFKYGFVEGQKTLKELDLDIWNQTYKLPENIAEHKYLVEKFSIFPYLDLYFKKELRDAIELKEEKNVINN